MKGKIWWAAGTTRRNWLEAEGAGEKIVGKVQKKIGQVEEALGIR